MRGNTVIIIMVLNYPFLTCSNMNRTLCCQSQASSSNVMDWVAFDVCGGNAGTQRGIVYRPIRLNRNGIVVRGCRNSLLATAVTDDEGPPPINCSDIQPRM